MLIRSVERPELWYRFTDEEVSMRIGRDMRAWSWSQMDQMSGNLKEDYKNIRKELLRCADAYRLLRVTPKEERTNNWRVRMASVLGMTYGKLQMRIQLGDIIWEEGSRC